MLRINFMSYIWLYVKRSKTYRLILLSVVVVNMIYLILKGFDKQPTAEEILNYPPSSVIEKLNWDFNNLLCLAKGSDLWPVTWASDDNLYLSWGDGVGFDAANFEEQWGKDRASLGFSRIEGYPPKFKVTNVWGGKNPENPAQFEGKSIGILSVDEILYAWINLQNNKFPDIDITLAWSKNLSATWQKVPWVFQAGDGNFKPSTFLNFGRDYAGARDDFVYFYGNKQGDSSGSCMGRVHKDRLKNRGSYEFLNGIDREGNPKWTSDVSKVTSVAPNASQVIYNSGLNRYILTSHRGSVETLGIFDAPEPWGPWTAVAVYNNWGEFKGIGLNYSFPTKWVSPDGRTMWMIFSSNGKLDSFNLIKATLSLKTSSQSE